MRMRFFSIRSNSPHNGPLRLLCGWVFHIEGRQRAHFEIDSFGNILYFLCKCSSKPGSHVQFQFWGDAILWVKIHCCFVAGSKLNFCPATNRISHESVPLPGRPWVSECYQFSFLRSAKNVKFSLLWQILFGIDAAGCRYGKEILHQAWNGKFILIKLPRCCTSGRNYLNSSQILLIGGCFTLQNIAFGLD